MWLHESRKYSKIPMPAWVIQSAKSLAACDVKDLASGYEPLFIDRFANKNYFSGVLHEGGITGVEQDNYDQDDDDDSD